MHKYAEQNTNVKEESCNSEFHALSDHQTKHITFKTFYHPRKVAFYSLYYALSFQL